MKQTVKKPTPTSVSKQLWEGVNHDRSELFEGIENKEFFETPSRKHPYPRPLLAAAMKNHTNATDELLGRGCNPFFTDDLGRSALGALAWNGHWEKVLRFGDAPVFKTMAAIEQRKTVFAEVLRAALTHQTVEWVEWAKQQGAKIDTYAGHTELQPPLNVSEQEWNRYKGNRNSVPPLFEMECSEEWVAKQKAAGGVFVWSDGQVPLEVYALGVSEEKRAWCKAHGIHTTPEEIPEDYRLLYLRMALNAPAYKPVPFGSIVALVESLDTLLPKKEDKQWMWLDVFIHAVEQRNAALQHKANAYAQEKYGLSLVNSVWPYLEQPRPSATAAFTSKPTWRDFHPVSRLIYVAGRNELQADAPTTANLNPFVDDQQLAAKNMRNAMNSIEGLFALGLSPQFTEKGWGYSLLHQAASTGSTETARILCDRDDVDLLQRSGRMGKGKTAREIAQSKGHVKVMALLEAAELKRKYRHEVVPSGAKWGDIL